MIEARNLSKKFDDTLALNNVSLSINDGSLFGLVGTNGAGKSTFLRLSTGILKADTGGVYIDSIDVYGNYDIKKEFFYIPDEPYFFPNADPGEMLTFYKGLYPLFNVEVFNKLLSAFDLPKKRKISTYSKGMKKLLMVAFALATGAKYLFCDETFDGLDPVMRQAVKSLFAKEMDERKLTPLITSHNLRELEDICDHVGLLHKGGILLSKDIDDMKLNIHKVQCVLKSPTDKDRLLSDTHLDIILTEQKGSLITLTIRGTGDEILGTVNSYEPIYAELIPLSLEEIFISETEVTGYDIKKLIF